MNFKNIQQSLLLISIVFLSSCQLDKVVDVFENLDIDATTYTGEFAVPLFHTQMNIDELLATKDSFSFLEIDDDGFMTVHYKGDVFTVNAAGLIPVISQALPIPITDTFTQIAFPIQSSFDLDFADLKAGSISYQLGSPFDEPIEVEVIMEDLSKDGNVLSRHFSLGPNESINIEKESLVDYRLDIENDTITVRYVSKKMDGTDAPLPIILVTIQDMNFSYVEGYFGDDNFDIAIDSIKIGLLENKLTGDIRFDDPKLTMTVSNSMGVPMNAKFNEVAVIDRFGNKITLESDFIENGVKVDYPTLSEVGERRVTIFDFDKTNSNLDVILNSGPVQVNYDIDGDPNPDNDFAIRGFFTDSSAVNINVELELPLYGTASGFLLRDTIDTDFPIPPAEFGGAELKLITDNELPLNLGLQIYFLDSTGVILDSLFANETNIISAATVDANGVVLKDTQGDPISQESIVFIDLSADTYNKVAKATEIVTQTAFSTYQNGAVPVKIFSSHFIKLRMGLKFKIDK